MAGHRATMARCPTLTLIRPTLRAFTTIGYRILAEAAQTLDFSQPVAVRQDEVAGFFAGLDLVEPGVVPVQDWRATSELDFNSAPTAMWGGVGRKE
jgi:S-adenosyl methyltransferase